MLFYFYRIFKLCQEIPKGITNDVISNDMPHVETEQRVMAINRLLSQVIVIFLELSLNYF